MGPGVGHGGLMSMDMDIHAYGCNGVGFIRNINSYAQVQVILYNVCTRSTPKKKELGTPLEECVFVLFCLDKCKKLYFIAKNYTRPWVPKKK